MRGTVAKRLRRLAANRAEYRALKRLYVPGAGPTTGLARRVTQSATAGDSHAPGPTKLTKQKATED